MLKDRHGTPKYQWFISTALPVYVTTISGDFLRTERGTCSHTVTSKNWLLTFRPNHFSLGSWKNIQEMETPLIPKQGQGKTPPKVERMIWELSENNRHAGTNGCERCSSFMHMTLFLAEFLFELNLAKLCFSSTQSLLTSFSACSTKRKALQRTNSSYYSWACSSAVSM